MDTENSINSNSIENENPEIQCVTVDTTHCGVCKVYVQGDLDTKSGATVFLTVHDMGSTPRSWINFVNDPAMADVKSNVFLHFAVPGQVEHAPDWPNEMPYPTLSQIAHDLVCVLDQLSIKLCVCIGEGAGANIVVRFAMQNPNRVYGVCLVKCTSTTAGVMEYVKDKYINFRLDGGKMHPSAYQYLLLHKFGPGGDHQHSDFVKSYLEDLQQRLNPGNLSRYLKSFVKRTDLSNVLAKELKCDCLLVAGSRAAHLHTVYTMHQAMSKQRTTLLIVDNVGDVMSEAPDKLVRGLILFCKGVGVLSNVSLPGMERLRTLSASMEEADRPRRSSLEMKG